ncbi:MAG: hypothetical protein IKO61_06315 [Lachnospiraceae bacterium]|nr:hypothetical protein [Lachnospiraceae bacterium]
MFGKLIKNEFSSRWKPVVALYIGLLAGSLSVFLLGLLHDNVESNFLNILYGVTVFLFIVSFFVIAACIFLLPLVDFRNRFFKEQLYLPRTMPVKLSQLLLVRYIFDITMVISMAIVYPISLKIVGTPDSFKKILETVEKVLNFLKIEISFRPTIILLAVTYFVSYLFVVWCFNYSYSFGHCKFKKSQPLASVLFFVGLSTVSNVLTCYLAQAMDKTDLWTRLYKATGNQVLASVNIILIITSTYMVLCTIIMIILTNATLKKKLKD